MRAAPAGPDAPEAVRRLCIALIEGLQNPERVSGSCQIKVHDAGLGASWPIGVRLSESAFNVDAEWLAAPSAQIAMPLTVAQRIVEEIHHVDFRDPSLTGEIELQGDRNLVNHVAKALLRPSPEVSARMRYASDRDVPAYRMTQIERLQAPTELEILERIEAGEPFVAIGLDLPKPCSSWSLEALVNHFGDLPLRVRSAHDRETIREFVWRVQEAEQADCRVPIIEGATKAYTEGCLLPEAMRADFLPQFFSRDDYAEPQIWLGTVPTDTPASSLHRDPLDGFLFQIMGRKRLLLYSPDQEHCLYPMRAWNNYQPCWVRPEAPNLSLFPAFANARPLEVVLHPGELLIQPAGWFHAVYCLDSPTFSVSYFLRH